MANRVPLDATTLCDLVCRMGEAEKRRDDQFFKTLLAEKLTFRRASKAVVGKATFIHDLLNPANTSEMLESERGEAERSWSWWIRGIWADARCGRHG